MPTPRGRVSAAPLILVGLGVVLVISSLLFLYYTNQKTTANQAGLAAPQASPGSPFQKFHASRYRTQRLP